jgi:putative endonuclease
MSGRGRSQNRRRIGKAYEDMAAAYFEAAGCSILARNYHARYGEVDLVVLDGETLVFAEVRMRGSADPVSPLETITAEKRRRMVLAAKAYLAEHDISDRDCRFDVIGIVHPRGQKAELEHLKNAFELEGE